MKRVSYILFFFISVATGIEAADRSEVTFNIPELRGAIPSRPLGQRLCSRVVNSWLWQYWTPSDRARWRQLNPSQFEGKTIPDTNLPLAGMAYSENMYMIYDPKIDPLFPAWIEGIKERGKNHRGIEFLRFALFEVLKLASFEKRPSDDYRTSIWRTFSQIVRNRRIHWHYSGGILRTLLEVVFRANGWESVSALDGRLYFLSPNDDFGYFTLNRNSSNVSGAEIAAYNSVWVKNLKRKPRTGAEPRRDPTLAPDFFENDYDLTNIEIFEWLLNRRGERGVSYPRINSHSFGSTALLHYVKELDIEDLPNRVLRGFRGFIQ